jgi:hypothetical protein
MILAAAFTAAKRLSGHVELVAHIREGGEVPGILSLKRGECFDSSVYLSATPAAPPRTDIRWHRNHVC